MFASASSSAVLRELVESHRLVQKSPESTSIWPSERFPKFDVPAHRSICTQVTEDAVKCYLGDFSAGSYNASIFLDTLERDGYGGLTWDRVANVSRDAFGVAHAVQYYPRVDSVAPSSGSLEGGTLLTIRGGGFDDDASRLFVEVAGRPCAVVSSTLVEITCKTADLSAVDAGPPRARHEELLRASGAAPASPEADVGPASWFAADEDAAGSGAWAAVASDGASGGSYSEAAGCGTPPCTPSWLVLAPANVTADGLYDVSLDVPAAAGAGFGCAAGAPLASSASVLVADAVRGYVHVNASLAAAAASTLFLGRFSFAAGAFDGRRGAVIVDTVGADGCVAVDGAWATRVGPMAGGNCSDPAAANYDATASSNATRDCLYVGGRGLRQRAWSLMAPGYRDGAWAKDRESSWEAFLALEPDTGGPRTCPAPRNASSDWKYNASYHEPCGPASYCCLTNDYYGCDATWDLADADGWVDVLRQDTEMGAPFDGSMKRRNAHDRTEENYAILDELERMRSLSTGRLELLLEWPGTGLSAMHWEQRMNPAKFTSRTREKQYAEALDYVAVSTPYFESNEWGGLEFDGSSALLDGSFDSSSWWYAVGSFSTSIPMTQGDEYVDDAWGNRATLKARPGDDSYFFAPTCVACDACYDADGRFLDNATVRTAPFNETCKLGEPCSVNGTTYETVKGCPDKCRGRRVRAFEAHAAHEAVVVAHRYDDDANCTASANASCAGYDATNAADVSFAPVYGPGAGSFEGFFVAPVSANYTFYATFDSDLELSLSESGDPRRRRVVLGGADAPDAADGDVFDGWTRFRGHWYKVFADDEHDVSYDAAEAMCEGVGGYLAELKSEAENDFVYGLLEAAGISGGSTWIGGRRDHLNMWTWRKSDVVFTAGAHYSTTVDAAYANWHSTEPNGAECACFWGGNRWDDQWCWYSNRFVCESSNGRRARSETFELRRGEARYFELLPGQDKRAKFPTSKAHISAVFHSFRLIFGRAIISRNGLAAWMLLLERARAEHSR